MKKERLILIFILLLGAFFRLYGLNWDQGHHLHPDERFLTMVATNIKWPSSIQEYFDPTTSPLNPRNNDFNFFVYGLFPIIFVKLIADIVGLGNYEGYTIVGRQVSTLIDGITILFVYKIAALIRDNLKRSDHKVHIPETIPLWAAFLYATTVLPIQLSHFFAVDLYVVLAIVANFYFMTKFVLVKKHIGLIVAMGIFLGIALASKISSILFVPFVAGTLALAPFLEGTIKNALKNLASSKRWGQAAGYIVTFFICAYLTLRIADPYMFASHNILVPVLNSGFVTNIKELQSWNIPNSHFPPSVQWITTLPILFPLQNNIMYGMGVPLALFNGMAFVLFPLILYRLFRTKASLPIIIVLAILWMWVGLVFFYQGIQFAKALRYFTPLYPFAAIITSLTGGYVWGKAKLKRLKIASLVLGSLALFIWPVSFVSIYSHDHTRVQASEFIYTNIPKGSTLSCEHWDDCLPLSLEKNGQTYSYSSYTTETLPLYDPDSPKKWEQINDKLQTIDYIILSSNRLYGSLTSVPERYPQTYEFYNNLFNGSLGFKKVAEFTSRPTFPLPLQALCLPVPGSNYGSLARQVEECDGRGIQFVDDYGEESYTVYDHPKVLIFKHEPSF